MIWSKKRKNLQINKPIQLISVSRIWQNGVIKLYTLSTSSIMLKSIDINIIMVNGFAKPCFFFLNLIATLLQINLRNTHTSIQIITKCMHIFMVSFIKWDYSYFKRQFKKKKKRKKSRAKQVNKSRNLISCCLGFMFEAIVWSCLLFLLLLFLFLHYLLTC